MKKLNKKQIVGITFVVLALFMTSFVSSFAVSSAYFEENPLEISVGETKDLFMTLQNNAGAEDVQIEASIAEGSTIAQITDSNKKYTIPAGGSTVVNYKITIPEDAKIGDSYKVGLTFKEIPSSQAGAVGIGSSIGKGFNVKVVPTDAEKKAAEKRQTFTRKALIVIAIIVIILIIWYFVRRNVKTKTDKKAQFQTKKK